MWSIISRIVTTNGPRTSLLQSGWLTAMFLKLRSGEGRFWTYNIGLEGLLFRLKQHLEKILLGLLFFRLSPVIHNQAQGLSQLFRWVKSLWVGGRVGGGGGQILNFLQLHLLVGLLALLHSFMVLRKHSLLVFDDVDLYPPASEQPLSQRWCQESLTRTLKLFCTLGN